MLIFERDRAGRDPALVSAQRAQERPTELSFLKSGPRDGAVTHRVTTQTPRKLLLRLLECMTDSHTRFAFPTQTPALTCRTLVQLGSISSSPRETRSAQHSLQLGGGLAHHGGSEGSRRQGRIGEHLWAPLPTHLNRHVAFAAAQFTPTSPPHSTGGQRSATKCTRKTVDPTARALPRRATWSPHWASHAEAEGVVQPIFCDEAFLQDAVQTGDQRQEMPLFSLGSPPSPTERPQSK